MRSDHAISIVGLGYVGLPIAAAFGRNGHRVIGFDIDSRRIAELRPEETYSNTINRADLALLRAKRSGRNRCELAD